MLDQLSSEDIKALWAMTLIALLMVVDAMTWKIDHALWSMGIAAISGLAGYSIRGAVETRRARNQREDAARS